MRISTSWHPPENESAHLFQPNLLGTVTGPRKLSSELRNPIEGIAIEKGFPVGVEGFAAVVVAEIDKLRSGQCFNDSSVNDPAILC